MDINELLKRLMTQTPTDAVIESTWTQVGKLSPADDGLRRSHMAYVNEKRLECEMLEKKIIALKTAVDATAAEWWAQLRKNYGLPSSGNFHLSDDGRIFMQPKELKPNAETEF